MCRILRARELRQLAEAVRGEVVVRLESVVVVAHPIELGGVIGKEELRCRRLLDLLGPRVWIVGLDPLRPHHRTLDEILGPRLGYRLTAAELLRHLRRRGVALIGVPSVAEAGGDSSSSG